MNDRIFEKADAFKSKDFTFNKSVTDVFEDMLNRSIPCYNIIQDLIFKVVNYKRKENGTICVFDIGCSHGYTMVKLSNINDIELHGFDLSESMLDKARANLESKSGINFELHLADLQNYNFQDLNVKADVVILCLTLQFIRPSNRKNVLDKIYNSLSENGTLILVEKTILPNDDHNNMFIDLYHDFKMSNGYSENEVLNKRLSIENVLIPYSVKENLELLEKVKFKKSTLMWQWLNFCAIIAEK